VVHKNSKNEDARLRDVLFDYYATGRDKAVPVERVATNMGVSDIGDVLWYLKIHGRKFE
jgi:hypothetical protein